MAAAILDFKKCHWTKLCTPSGKCCLRPLWTNINRQKKSVQQFHLKCDFLLTNIPASVETVQGGVPSYGVIETLVVNGKWHVWRFRSFSASLPTLKCGPLRTMLASARKSTSASRPWQAMETVILWHLTVFSCNEYKEMPYSGNCI